MKLKKLLKFSVIFLIIIYQQNVWGTSIEVQTPSEVQYSIHSIQGQVLYENNMRNKLKKSNLIGT